MLYKKINLIIFSSNTPYQLTISTCQGQFIAKKNISTNPVKYCLCTTSCCLKLSAKYQNQTITKVINLSNKFCQNFIVNFNFTLPISQPVINNFILKDALYSLPINEAILSFKLQN